MPKLRFWSSDEEEVAEQLGTDREKFKSSARQRAQERVEQCKKERLAKFAKETQPLEARKEEDVDEIRKDVQKKENELRATENENRKRREKEFENLKRRETEQLEQEVNNLKQENQNKSREMNSRILETSSNSQKVENELDQIDERKLTEQIRESEKTEELRKKHQIEKHEQEMRLDSKKLKNDNQNLAKILKVNEDCQKEAESNYRVVYQSQQEINQVFIQDFQQILKLKVEHSFNHNINAVNAALNSLKTGYSDTFDSFISFSNLAFTVKNRDRDEKMSDCMRATLKTRLDHLSTQLTGQISIMNQLDESISHLKDEERQTLHSKIRETKQKITKARLIVSEFSAALESGWEKKQEHEFKSIMDSISTSVDSFEMLKSGTAKIKSMILAQEKISQKIQQSLM